MKSTSAGKCKWNFNRPKHYGKYPKFGGAFLRQVCAIYSNINMKSTTLMYARGYQLVISRIVFLATNNTPIT